MEDVLAIHFFNVIVQSFVRVLYNIFNIVRTQFIIITLFLSNRFVILIHVLYHLSNDQFLKIEVLTLIILNEQEDCPKFRPRAHRQYTIQALILLILIIKDGTCDDRKRIYDSLIVSHFYFAVD